jgi:hypothetical protein
MFADNAASTTTSADASGFFPLTDGTIYGASYGLMTAIKPLSSMGT